jgi:hypothetical protein
MATRTVYLAIVSHRTFLARYMNVPWKWLCLSVTPQNKRSCIIGITSVQVRRRRVRMRVVTSSLVGPLSRSWERFFLPLKLEILHERLRTTTTLPRLLPKPSSKLQVNTELKKSTSERVLDGFSQRTFDLYLTLLDRDTTGIILETCVFIYILSYGSHSSNPKVKATNRDSVVVYTVLNSILSTRYTFAY